MPRHVLVTGSTGAIGAAISKKFKETGCAVCGIDKIGRQSNRLDFFIEADLNQYVVDERTRQSVMSKISTWLGGNTLDVLINNAGYQYVSQRHPIPVEELTKSHNINVIAPYLLVTNLANAFTDGSASVVNIGSIHRKSTKPGFVAYAMTKAALASLTKGLALDYENRFRINCIEPASVETPMLLDGFKDAPERKLELESYHPQKRLTTTDEVAELAFMISSETVSSLHGSCIEINGGIGSALHDPASIS